MFYERYTSLCKRKGVSPSRAAQDIGLSRATVVKWKNGAIPGGKSLQKLSEYFGVPLGMLMGDALQAPHVTETDIKFALFSDSENVTDEMYAEVKAFAEYVQQKYKANPHGRAR